MSYPMLKSDFHNISGLSPEALTPMTLPSIVLASTSLLSSESPIDSLTVAPPRSDCHRSFPVLTSRQAIFLSGATTNRRSPAATGTHAAGESILFEYPLFHTHLVTPVAISRA